jgi:rubrerythrin
MIMITHRRLISLVAGAGLLAGCASTNPPSFAPGDAGDPQVRVPRKAPRNLLVHDETTLAIQAELSQTERDTKSSESMQHNNMPGMQHGDMKMENHKETPNPTNVEQEKKAIAEEMKKTSDEMKRTSETMKKAEQTSPQNFYYTCRMHPQVHADKPGKCPICGMTLIKKEGAPPK